MTEIKFMAWHKEYKLLKPVCSINWDENCAILDNFYEFGYFGHCEVSLDEIVLLQYAGIKDKHGVEIYTGFFVKWGLRVYEIRFDCGFYMHDLSGINPDYPITKEFENASDEFEVIGNIYENKELLKDIK